MNCAYELETTKMFQIFGFLISTPYVFHEGIAVLLKTWKAERAPEVHFYGVMEEANKLNTRLEI